MEVIQTSPENQSSFTLLQVKLIVFLFIDIPNFSEYSEEMKTCISMKKKYINNMNEIVEKYNSTNLRRDLRMADYIRRIPLAISRASFSPVDNNIIKEAASIFEESIGTCS